MNFKVVKTMVYGLRHIIKDWPDGTRTVVSELVLRKKKWELFHVHALHELSHTERDEMNVFANKQIVLMNITERLTK